MGKSVALYVHIPYCKRKCDYCDFFSRTVSSVPDQYITAVLNEINWRVKKYGISAWRTVYIGGGTPSLLSSVQLVTLIKGILSACGNKGKIADEITVEMNPDDITVALLDAAEYCGVTRISVGIQSLDDTVLSFLHRRCSRETSLAALECIQKNWKLHFSADMIAGLPYLDNQKFCHGLEELISYGSDHISLYSLVIEKNTPLGKNIGTGGLVYDYDFADAQWILGRDLLEGYGMHQYEVSNFSRPGAESIHNMAYWNQENYVGAGAGATGTIYDIAPGKGIRWTNTCDTDTYLSYWCTEQKLSDSPPCSLEKLNLKTEEFEFFMMGLRTLKGISTAAYTARFGRNLEKRLGACDGGLFDTWQSRGLACHFSDRGDNRYALTPQGLLFLNSFLESLL